MAGPLNGKVSLDLMTGETFTLQYSVDTLITLEERLDLNVMEIGQQMAEGMRLGMLRTVLWAGLLDNHEISEREAGELIPRVEGGAMTIANKIGQAFAAAFPVAEEGTTKPGPRKAARRAGTGKASS